ncbi:MAG: hypothetical protein V4813_18755 [Gemmatimonadota bacterium]
MHLRLIGPTLLVFVLVACSQQDKKPRLAESAVVGTWMSDTVPGADVAQRVFRLRMDQQGMAEFSRIAVGKGIVTERGTWDGADSLVRVVVRGEGTASRPTSLLLAIRGRAELGLVQFDTAAWGQQGLRLFRQRTDSTAARQ